MEMTKERVSIDGMLLEADRLENSGHIREALDCFRVILNQEEDPYLLFRYGLLAMELEEWEKARQAFLSGVSLAPEFPLGYTYLGTLYRKQGDPKTAIAYYERSTEIEEDATTYTLLGAAQSDIGRIEAAQSSFCKAIDLDPSCEEAYYNLGVTHRFEQPEKAISLFQKTLDIDPENALAHCELGWLYKRLGRLPEAENYLRKAIELNDSDGWSYIYLGNLLWTQKNKSAAEQMFIKAIEVYPEDSFTHWCLAIFYQYNGRSQEADFFYEKAVQLNPDDASANFRFGWFLKDLGENAKAKEYLKRTLASEPENYDAKFLLTELEELEEAEIKQKAN
jgi:tetratricopeptide (TPR) repeat protein